jgi:hypothetical protein
MHAQPPDCEIFLLFSNLTKIHPTTLLFSIESGNNHMIQLLAPCDIIWGTSQIQQQIRYNTTEYLIHYVYFSSSMSSKGQCSSISARSSADMAAANVSPFICLLRVIASS